MLLYYTPINCSTPPTTLNQLEAPLTPLLLLIVLLLLLLILLASTVQLLLTYTAVTTALLLSIIGVEPP
jgi:hypothetical protein